MPLITIRFAKRCPVCHEYVRRGDPGWWDSATSDIFHPLCAKNAGAVPKRYALLSPGGTKAEFQFEFDPVVINAVRQIPGAAWSKESGRWMAPINIASAEAIARFVTQLEFIVPPDLDAKVAELMNRAQANSTASRATEEVIKIRGLGGTLRPFQNGGVAYAVKNRRVIIADPPGLGKTVQGLGWVHMIQEFPVMVVCPERAKEVWRRHILGEPKVGQVSWLPYIDPEEVLVLSGRKVTPLAKKYAFIILNWDILAAWQHELKRAGCRMMIFDEIHRAKNGKSARGRAAFEVSAKCENILGLSGTPFLNRPEEIYQPLRIIRRDKEFGDWWTFVHRYCNAHQGSFGLDTSGHSNLDELNDRLRSICYVRRRRQDVYDELPPKERIPVPIRLSNWNEYVTAESNLAKWLGEQAAEDKEFLASISHHTKEEQRVLKIQRARSVEAQRRRNERLHRFWALKKLSAMGKLDQTVELITDLNEMGEKVVVFAWHVDVQHAIYERLPRAVHIFSEDTRKEGATQAAIDGYMNNPAIMNVVCCYGANEAITLNAGTNVVFLEFAWGPGTQEQAEDRVYRMLPNGAMNKAVCHYTAGLETVDEEIISIIDGKAEVTYAAADGGVIDEETGVVNHLVGKVLAKYKDTLRSAS